MSGPTRSKTDKRADLPDGGEHARPAESPSLAQTPAAVVAAGGIAGNQALNMRFAQLRHRTARPDSDGRRSPAIGLVVDKKAAFEKREKPTDNLDVDKVQALLDRGKARKKLEKVPTLYVAPFLDLLDTYVLNVIDRDLNGAVAALKDMLAFADSQHMFEINNEKYMRLGANGQVPKEVLEQTAAESTERGNLWSKINSYYSIDAAVASGGVSLESTVAGHIFDGLGFGMARGNLIAKEQWDLVSKTYVQHLKGDVHAAMFRAVHPESVLTRIEWPEISTLIKRGAVRKLVVHIFDFDSSGEMTEIEQCNVYSDAGWERLPRIKQEDMGDWEMVQNQVQQGEYARGVGHEKHKDRFAPTREKIPEGAGKLKPSPGPIQGKVISQILKRRAALVPIDEAGW